MTRLICSTLLLAVAAAGAQTETPTNAPAAPKSISIQEMLVIGHSGMKLHALAMVTQGKVQDGVDESFLPGFKICSEDPASPVRSVTARLLGQYFVQDQETPNPKAMELLIKLAGDESADVRFNAVYHGLSQVKDKSPELIERLIETAATNRDQALYGRIIESLQDSREAVTDILDDKLENTNDIAFFEIYEDFTGKAPPQAEKYLQLPSSRPRLFIFQGNKADPEAFKTELTEALKLAGIESPDVQISGTGDNHVLLVKTYLTKDYKAIEAAFADSDQFRITQDMWLTPELEVQIEAMHKR